MWCGCEQNKTSTTTVVSEALHLHRNTMKNATSKNNEYSYDERRTAVHIWEFALKCEGSKHNFLYSTSRRVLVLLFSITSLVGWRRQIRPCFSNSSEESTLNVLIRVRRGPPRLRSSST